MRPALPLAAVAFLLMAGCSTPGSTSAGSVEAAFVTPGVWDVRANTEQIMAWAHNLESAPATVAFSLTAPGGGPLPTGWEVSFDHPTLKLEADGTAGAAGKFPAWGITVLTLRIPSGFPAGNTSVELHANDAVHPATVVVHGTRITVAAIGQTVTVGTVGTFRDSGEEFWSGDFSTAIGPAARAVQGVGWGLVGAAQGETVGLVVPPAFAYGYDNPVGSGYEQFNGKTLVFTMTVKKIQ